MAKRMLVRADDLGWTEAINYGIAKAVKEGIIGSVGLMPNMPAAGHGIELLAWEKVCVGQHTNICGAGLLQTQRGFPACVRITDCLSPAGFTGQPRRILWFWMRRFWRLRPSTRGLWS